MRAMWVGCVSAVGVIALATSGCMMDTGLGRVPAGRRVAGQTPAQVDMAARIVQEAPGDYFIGRRYFKNEYKFWGFVRRPGQQWRSSELVMLNEQRKLAPDRAAGNLGMDNNVEYRLRGRFTGERVYEPASNGFYPEFLLDEIELLEREPPSIFPGGAPNLPASRVIQSPS